MKEIIIAFWFLGNTLYWCGVETDQLGTKKYHYSDYYFLKLQLDKNLDITKGIYPEINKDPIESIKVNSDTVIIYTKNKYWILHYTDEIEGLNWYIEDWRKL